MSPEDIQRLEQDVQRILSWPRATRSPQELDRLHERRAFLHSQMIALADLAERDDRNLTVEERERFDAMAEEYDRLQGEVSLR